MHPENPNEKIEAEGVGYETAEGLIGRVEELLDRGLYDEEEYEEAQRMLRTAQLLAQDTKIRKEIDQLFVDIENSYGSSG